MITQTQKMSLTQNALIETVNTTTVHSILEVPKKRSTPIPFMRLLVMGVTTVSNWFDRAHHRRDLMNLNDHILKDIGMTRWDILQEYEKPFWKE